MQQHLGSCPHVMRSPVKKILSCVGDMVTFSSSMTAMFLLGSDLCGEKMHKAKAVHMTADQNHRTLFFIPDISSQGGPPQTVPRRGKVFFGREIKRGDLRIKPPLSRILEAELPFETLTRFNPPWSFFSSSTEFTACALHM